MTRRKKTPLQRFETVVDQIYLTCDNPVIEEVDVPTNLSGEQRAAALRRLAEATTAVLRFSDRIERLRPKAVLQRRRREPSDEERMGGKIIRGLTFGEAYDVATGALAPGTKTGGSTEPLADWLEYGPQLKHWQQCMVADLLRAIPDKRRHGERGRNREPRLTRNQVQYQVAREVIERQQAWCKQHLVAGRPAKKTPWPVTKAFIEEEISATSPLREEWQRADNTDRFSMVEQIKRLMKNRKRAVKAARPRVRRIR